MFSSVKPLSSDNPTLAVDASSTSPNIKVSSSLEPLSPSTTSFLAMTWNLEGFGRNVLNLKHFINIHLPDIIFLTEPMIFASDADLQMKYLCGEYCFTLNSADKYDPELPLIKSRAHGGTMILWKLHLDPFISVCPVTSSSFLPITFQPPGSPLSIHICVYLPTLGQENQFIEEIAQLTITVDELLEKHPGAPVFLRGDFNVSGKNPTRSTLLNYFSNNHALLELKLPHPTYHHFMGNGKSDSFLDKFFFSKSLFHPEILKQIHCKLSDPFIDSHHDMILTQWTLPNVPPVKPSSNNVVAPKVANKRSKVFWSDQGIDEYQSLVVPHLERVQKLWLASPSKSAMSLLLESTNNILTSCASITNETVPIAVRSDQKSRSTPPAIRTSKNKLLKLYRNMKKNTQIFAHDMNFDMVDIVKLEYSKSRDAHRKLTRNFKSQDAFKRDSELGTFASDPSLIHKKIKASRRCKAGKVQSLKVGPKTYVGDSVCDGFFDSISTLKSLSQDPSDSSPYFDDFSCHYHNILELCKGGEVIPPISEKDSFELLQKLKPNVNDIQSVTPNHYNYAGPAGWKHFYLLINALLSDVNNTSIDEINAVYACIIFKGHGKDKSSDRSYRTISTCPVVAKALDLYIRDLNIKSWNLKQAETQFQGEGSSHELAAVLLTETIQHSLYSLKQPLFALYLDAMSAFDIVLKQLLIKNLFHANTTGQTLLYLDNRLENRKTFIDWDGQLMGPISDERGLEQGGPNSTDFYKIFGEEQLSTAQLSSLGIQLGDLTISGIGQADDTVLISNRIQNLKYLLHLTKIFCSKYQVQLCSDKTKLQAFSTKDMSFTVSYAKTINPIEINNETIEFSENAEHVGMLRSSSGNLLTILTRITAHRKALASVLHTGMARGHRGNPAVSINIENLYGVPVLLSGIGPLVLSKSDVNIIDQHHRETLRSLQRLHKNTPRTVTCFLAGSLPGSALVHLRQLSIFGMISRLKENVLHAHATNYFSSATISPKSWFQQIRELCLTYKLPHPLELLTSPPAKSSFKTLVKKSVISFWEIQLRQEASLLPSLMYFKPAFMSLTSPHPLWLTAGSSPSKVTMATVQSLMVSGRYRTESLCSNWSKNKTGVCLLSPECSNTKEDIPHILKSCQALAKTRGKLISFTHEYSDKLPADIKQLSLQLCNQDSPTFVQFLLDCSVLPSVITATQLHGNVVLDYLFSISRTWVYCLHRERLKILGLWK